MCPNFLGTRGGEYGCRAVGRWALSGGRGVSPDESVAARQTAPGLSFANALAIPARRAAIRVRRADGCRARGAAARQRGPARQFVVRACAAARAAATDGCRDADEIPRRAYCGRLRRSRSMNRIRHGQCRRAGTAEVRRGRHVHRERSVNDVRRRIGADARHRAAEVVAAALCEQVEPLVHDAGVDVHTAVVPRARVSLGVMVGIVVRRVPVVRREVRVIHVAKRVAGRRGRPAILADFPHIGVFGAAGVFLDHGAEDVGNRFVERAGLVRVNEPRGPLRDTVGHFVTADVQRDERASCRAIAITVRHARTVPERVDVIGAVVDDRRDHLAPALARDVPWAARAVDAIATVNVFEVIVHLDGAVVRVGHRLLRALRRRGRIPNVIRVRGMVHGRCRAIVMERPDLLRRVLQVPRRTGLVRGDCLRAAVKRHARSRLEVIVFPYLLARMRVDEDDGHARPVGPVLTMQRNPVYEPVLAAVAIDEKISLGLLRQAAHALVLPEHAVNRLDRLESRFHFEDFGRAGVRTHVAQKVVRHRKERTITIQVHDRLAAPYTHAPIRLLHACMRHAEIVDVDTVHHDVSTDIDALRRHAHICLSKADLLGELEVHLVAGPKIHRPARVAANECPRT